MRKALVACLLAGLILLSSVPAQAQEIIHVVRAGQTLFGISRQYGVNIVTLAQVNGIANPNRIYVGQRLTIPTGSTAPAPAPSPAPVVPSGTYVVVRGDTLFGIARRHNTTVWAIAQANSIQNINRISVGQRLIIPGGNPGPAPAPNPAPPPVSSGAFELGGHIREMGIPHAERMRNAGMNWVKTQVHYGQSANDAIATAHAQGFKIQLSAIGGPDLVTQPGFENNFATWVAGLAAAGADAIEVWNEPNIDREWKIGQISPQAYTSLLCKSYAAIKAANSRTDVISAAPAPTGWFGGCSANGCDDKPWMEGLYAAGAARCMDYIGAHHNSGATSPSARVGHPANPTDRHHSWFFLPQTELYYNIFRGTRKIVYTEMGYASQEGVPGFSDQFAWARGTTNAQQAAWLAEAVRLSISTGMVRCVIVWNIDFVRHGYDPQDGYAILRPGGGCPACDSLHAVLGRR
jgi:LysM repeat protein